MKIAARTALPKHREVEGRLRDEILTGVWSAAERLPAEPDLALRFGVAYMTVRQAVSSLVAEGLLQRINGKGTFIVGRPPAEGESAVTARSLLFLVPGIWQRLDPYYFPDILTGFDGVVRSQERRADILDYAAAEQDNLFVRDAAIACLLIGEDETHLVERLRDRGCRVLAVNRYAGRRVLPCVAPDNAGGTEQAVHHLVALGHQRIGFVRGIPGNLDGIDRRRGYRRAMRRHELPPVEAGDHFHEEAGHRAALELLSAPDRPTALVCASDLSALGAIKAAHSRGLTVPGDLSVVGFGDFSVAAYVHHGLTTVYLPRRELGAAAARTLMALADGAAVANELLPTRLIVRGTSGPI